MALEKHPGAKKICCVSQQRNLDKCVPFANNYGHFGLDNLDSRMAGNIWYAESNQEKRCQRLNTLDGATRTGVAQSAKSDVHSSQPT